MKLDWKVNSKLTFLTSCFALFPRTQESDKPTEKKVSKKKKPKKKERLEEEAEDEGEEAEGGWEKVKGGVPLVKVKKNVFCFFLKPLWSAKNIVD